MISLFCLAITVNDQELLWDRENVYTYDDIVVQPMIERYEAMEVDFISSDFSLVVMRHNGTIGRFLGLYLTSTDGLSSDTKGIMGMLREISGLKVIYFHNNYSGYTYYKKVLIHFLNHNVCFVLQYIISTTNYNSITKTH